MVVGDAGCCSWLLVVVNCGMIEIDLLLAALKMVMTTVWIDGKVSGGS